jgi:tRNA(Arg) A34 adenosine deaminase TadA
VDQDEKFMALALELAQQGLSLGHGGPFGALVVQRGKVIGRGWNQVIYLNDPTAHAEMQAIREACQTSGSFHLQGAVLYTTCEPCPMCLSAVYWAHIERVVYAASAEDASDNGFSDNRIAEELCSRKKDRVVPSHQVMRDQSLLLFKIWQNSEMRVEY